MSRIPSQFITDLMNRVDIVEVIDQRVPLKKAGKEHKACCPFHSEKTPSFTVNAAKQFYHCFGCGANGNAISFLMEYDHLTFPETIATLANMAGVEVPQEAHKNNTVSTQPLYDILEAANEYYQMQLRQHADKELAVNYLKDRGVSGSIAKKFKLGYAPRGWDNLKTALKNYSAAQLTAAGLAIEKSKNDSYDRFRHRIMFPIRDRRGRVIAFGGRVLSDEDEPKYLNSPETEVFHKRRELYGLYEALQANRDLKRLLVVEGYMDVVALAQYGISYAVATLGTATTDEHIHQLFRHCSEVSFCFDGDRAGYDAGWKALNVILPILEDGWQINFMFLAENEDPDSFVRKIGKEKFEHELANATPLAKFFFAHLTKDIEMNRLDGQAKLVKLALPLLQQIPGKILRHKLLEELATYAQVPSAQLETMLTVNPEHLPSSAATVKKLIGTSQKTVMQQAISMLLQHPTLSQQVQDRGFWKTANIAGASLFAELLELTANHPHLSTGAIVEHWRNQVEFSYLTTLASRELLTPEDGLNIEFQDILSSLSRELREQQLNVLQRKAKQGELNSADREQYVSLLSQK